MRKSPLLKTRDVINVARVYDKEGNEAYFIAQQQSHGYHTNFEHVWRFFLQNKTSGKITAIGNKTKKSLMKWWDEQGISHEVINPELWAAMK